MWRCRGMEIWRCAAGVAFLSQEIWRRAAGVGTCRSLPQELWSSEVRCRRCLKRDLERRDVEVWSSGALANCLLLLEFLAFVHRGTCGKTLAVCIVCSAKENYRRYPKHC